MTAIILTAPATEPVSLSEAKAHLKIDTTDEDILVQSLLTAARLHVETITSRVVITQTWRINLDHWPARNILELPIGPVQSVDAIRIYDDDDIIMTIDPSRYLVDVGSVPARIAMRGFENWPDPGRILNGIEIDITAGYGLAATDVPEPLRHSILMLAAHWFENREPLMGTSGQLPVPAAVSALIAPYQTARL
ncbi:MAG: phage head-tail connector protein [Rhizobiales bacterium]|nr:phage head-tail connector protein [Hyphomicrobiales bacterium]